MQKYDIELINISKSFGIVKANSEISLSIAPGEIHALLGENGSGKSTLMNILSGIYTPDEGIIKLDGSEVKFNSPSDSIAAGIGMVHQHFKLVDVMSATENIRIGLPGGLFIKPKKAAREIQAVADKYGLKIDLSKKVYEMSVSEKQTVEIMKVLYRGARILILDEPTAVLTPQEIVSLFGILRNMKASGCSIIIITHKLNEVMEISDRVTVLHKGRSIKTLVTSETDMTELTTLMVGKPISLEIKRTDAAAELIKPLLEVSDLTVLNADKREVLDNMSFTLSSGEILGVAGIAGSGQKELCETIAGLQRAASGDIIYKGQSIIKMNPRDIIKKGITMSFIPEDRLGMGLVGGMSVIDNVILKKVQMQKGIIVDRKAGKKAAERMIERFGINTPSTHTIVRKLSGGNIQKVLLGREIEMNPELLITAYPVRGLDIGASYNIYDILNEQKSKGVGILFIGEDLDVLLGLCDRIMVIHSGKNMGIVDAKSTTKEKLGLMMLGQRPDDMAS